MSSIVLAAQHAQDKSPIPMNENASATNSWSVDQWEDAIRAVFKQSLLSPEFRSLAISDPNAAILQATGSSAPDGLKLRFVENIEENVLVLPSITVAPNRLTKKDISRILYHAFRQQSHPPVFKSSPDNADSL